MTPSSVNYSATQQSEESGEQTTESCRGGWFSRRAGSGEVLGHFRPPLVDAGGPRPGKADPMLPTDGHSALPVSPRLLLMSQGEGFFLVNIWFVTVRIYTLYSSPHTHFISLDFDLACKEAMCKLPQASKKRVFMRCWHFDKLFIWCPKLTFTDSHWLFPPLSIGLSSLAVQLREPAYVFNDRKEFRYGKLRWVLFIEMPRRQWLGKAIKQGRFRSSSVA